MIRLRVPRSPADPHAEAARWSARRRLGLVTDREEEAFVRWLETPENRLAWQETDDLVEDAGAFAAIPELRAMRESALAAGPDRLRHRWRWVAAGAIAASAAGLLALTSVELAAPLSAPAEQATPRTQRYATAIGERRDVRLPDGSVVALNTASVIEVAYRADRRDIRLLAGQAMFSVAKDRARPFTVTAGERRITATGTRFDVRLDDKGGVTVLLVEGRVHVDPVKPMGLARLVPSLAREALEPGEMLTSPVQDAAAAPAAPVVAAALDVEGATSWTHGQVVFRDARLADAVAEMNRYSTARLVIESARVGDLRVSGTFSTGRNDNFVAAITSFFPIEAERQSPGVTTLNWRDKRSAK